MCGLVGVAGKIQQKERDIFRTLLVVDTLRGPHSTGVASVKTNGDWSLAKKKGNTWDLFDSREFTDVMGPMSYALIGHNRYATKGKINNINAHPFEFEDVVGAHNGTIRSQHKLIDHLGFEVDSENIFYSIQQIGLEDTLNVLDGAYALSYWDRRSEEFILLRNSERTLYYCFSKDRQSVFWASEAWMLSVACSRHGVAITDIVEVKPCVIHRFDIERKFQARPVQVSFQNFQEYTPPRLPATQSQSPFYGNGKGAGQGQGKKPEDVRKEAGPKLNSHFAKQMLGSVVEFTVEGHKQTAHKQWFVEGRLKVFPEATVRIFAIPDSDLWNELVLNYDSVFEGEINSFAALNDMIHFNLKMTSVQEVIDEEDEDETIDTVVVYNNKLVSDEEFERLVAPGCAWCSGKVTLLDAKYLHWNDHDSFICADCQEVDEVKEYIGG